MAAPSLDDTTVDAVSRILRSGNLAQGPEVERFEKAFAAYIGTKYAVATSSGTTALHLALLAAGIGPGDEVITTPFSFIATANVILYCGACPVFVDIQPDTFDLDWTQIEGTITPRTKAILPVHLYGQPCDMDHILNLCRQYGLTLIEDACQAHGAEYHGQKVGSFGTGCFSFYPTKNMTTGEGGMLTTNDVAIADKARMMRSHGQDSPYHHTVLGYNYRMTDGAAAIGLCQLPKLDYFNVRRIENASLLTDGLLDIKGLLLPCPAVDRHNVFHQYTLRVTKEFKLTRDQLAQHLQKSGIATAVYYPTPIHKQPLYSDLGYHDNLPVAETAAREVLSLPVHPWVTTADIERIVEAIRNA